MTQETRTKLGTWERHFQTFIMTIMVGLTIWVGSSILRIDKDIVNLRIALVTLSTTFEEHNPLHDSNLEIIRTDIRNLSERLTRVEDRLYPPMPPSP